MSPQNPPAQPESGRSSEGRIHQGGSCFRDTYVRDKAYVFQGNSVVHISAPSSSPVATRPDFDGHFAHAASEPVKAFVPRSSLHDKIHTQLTRVATDNSTKTLVVWGLGGSGKTQLVLDYTQKRREEKYYKSTIWIEADRKESLERDFVCLYQILFPEHTPAGSNSEMTSVEHAVTGVKSWFAGRQGRRLMVFDGADTIEDANADGYIDIKHFIPSTASLDVIITTRNSRAKDMTRLEGVEVGKMEAGQAVELFRNYAHLPRFDATVRDEVMHIVKKLGCLALAVTLAATYVGLTPRLRSNIKAYLPEYQQRRQELLQHKPESLVHQYNKSVLTTWETSYAAVSNQCIEASILMTILSFLSSDEIYVELFCPETENGVLEQIGETGVSWKRLVSPKQPVTKYKIEDWFKELERYSLIQWNDKKQGYVMHKLVHAWGYERLTTKEKGKYSQAAFGLIMETIEGCGRVTDNKFRLMPRVIANLTIMIREQGNIDKKADMQKVVLEKFSRILGENDSHTIWAMSNLAKTLRQQRYLEEAAEMQKKVLEKQKQKLGEDHPCTIGAMNNLANTLRQQGYLEAAAEMQQKVLEKQTQKWGENHPCTIRAAHNLAATLSDQGYLDKAVEMQIKVQEKCRQVLGDDHLTTIEARKNLNITLNRQKPNKKQCS
ncbi:P-loop containing nucleoside triphosphate hydrolase protein [Bipolaris maydis]|nr:P-loop containing nucleoside triphosphate hydrolase protein [Bipolaris maydis]KAJ6278567.1 P-loop containing nucleoside triphosphate hydrolase protein [Bipolaris maydis]